MAILLLLCTAFVIILIAWFVAYFKYAIYLRKIPGPWPVPILGNILDIGTTEQMLESFMRFRERYGTKVIITIGFGPPLYLISGTKELELLLSSTNIINKGNDYVLLHNWLGSGLLTSSRNKWRKHRKILTPAFHFQILEQFIDVFNNYSDILVKKLETNVGKDSINIYPYITLCSLDIICASTMGTEVKAQEETDSEYVQSVKDICRIIIKRATTLLKYDLVYMFSSEYWRERKGLKILHNYTNSVIASRKKELENLKLHRNMQNDVDDLGRKKKRTFLDLLLEYKDNTQDITDEDIRQEVDTFMFEGHDTTASGITFILYCLANNPEAQAKVIDELNSIIDNDKATQPTYRNLQDMKYLEMVIKESLRLYPPVPFYSRNTHEEMEFDGTTIPKDVEIVVLAHVIHKCPKVYPDPERFDPERFTPENQAKRSPYAYIPFSAGPRNCIGQKFAMLEMKAVVSKVVRCYELLPAIPEHKLKLAAETVLKSSNGVCIRLKKRS